MNELKIGEKVAGRHQHTAFFFLGTVADVFKTEVTVQLKHADFLVTVPRSDVWPVSTGEAAKKLAEAMESTALTLKLLINEATNA